MPATIRKHNWSYQVWKAISSFFAYAKKILQIVTIFLRYLWLLFPAFLFLLLAYFCFWTLLQGKDLLISGLEEAWRGSVLLIAVVFWSFPTWYSSRILVYKKEDLLHCGKNYFLTDLPKSGWNINWALYKSSEVIGFHLPRIMGYLCFALIVLAYAQLPFFQHPLHRSTAGWLVIGYLLVYAIVAPLLHHLGCWLLAKGGLRLLSAAYWSSFIIFVLFVLKPLFFPFCYTRYAQNGITTILLLSILQHLYLFVVVNRRLLLDAATPEKQKYNIIQSFFNWIEKTISRVLHLINVPRAEWIFFFVFNVISFIAIAIYLTGVFDLHFAMTIGSLNFAILAFGILVGFFEFLTFFSITNRINVPAILLLLVLVIGYFRETHYVRLIKKDIENLQKVRPDLSSYFTHWIQQHDDSIKRTNNYPIYFILADGGASRSGYWVASVLGKLHDATNGRFEDHLFALSGASGGSVGNGAYFTLLYYKDRLKDSSFLKLGQDFLQHDFLSYTLARMLGPDFFRPLLPFDSRNMYDRAGALEKAMEAGAGDTTFLNQKFALPFSTFIPDTANIQLPILCINVTRMQDGLPGVISNIKIADSSHTFGKRIDVLNWLQQDTDMHFSTAVVLGARFPYISPAGRINYKGNKDTVSYFVDGGYFDNSGAGVVHEMIIALQQLIEKKMQENIANSYLKKISFYVIHITNSPESDPKLRKVHLLQNDLMAPIATLVGSFGTQTDVNNSRLEKYLQLVYGNTSHFKKAELYFGIKPDSLSFPMNWSISNYYQDKMNRQLNNQQITALIDTINQQTNFFTTDTTGVKPAP